MVKRYTIKIQWRGFRWVLHAKARCAVDLVVGMMCHFQADAAVSVNRDFSLENAYANAMIRRDKIERHANSMDTDIYGRPLLW